MMAGGQARILTQFLGQSQAQSSSQYPTVASVIFQAPWAKRQQSLDTGA